MYIHRRGKRKDRPRSKGRRLVQERVGRYLGKGKKELDQGLERRWRKSDGANSVEKENVEDFRSSLREYEFENGIKREIYIINKLLEGEEEKDLVPDVFVSIRTASIGLKSRSSFLFRRD